LVTSIVVFSFTVFTLSVVDLIVTTSEVVFGFSEVLAFSEVDLTGSEVVLTTALVFAPLMDVVDLAISTTVVVKYFNLQVAS